MKTKSSIFTLIFSGILITLTLAMPALAQEPPTRFERISLEEGLSQVTVYCILQDHSGFMWFCTEDGLNRYDGYNFTVYKRDPENPNSLSSSVIRSLYEDSSGMLWVGTLGGGLDSFDRTAGQFTHYRNDPDDPQSLGSDYVTVIYEDSSGVLWIGTEGDGLDAFDRETGRFTHYPDDPDGGNVSSVYEDSSGVLWVGTWGGGLGKLDRETGRFTHYRNDPDDPGSLSHDEVTAIYEDHTGALWVGTFGGGLNKFDRETAERFTHYRNDPDDPGSLPHDEVTAIYEDHTGALWVGTTLGGLGELDRRTGKFARYQNDPNDPYSLSFNEITDIYEDGSGVLWFGTTLGGLNKLDLKTRRFAHYHNDPEDPHSLTSNMVWSIYEDSSGTLWVGTSGPTGGLNRLDRATGRFTHYRHDPDDPHSLGSTATLVIHEDSSGTLWVGTWGGGLNRLDRETGKFARYKNDPDDPDSLSEDVVWALYEDSTGAFWVGTFSSGLERFDRETGRFTHYRHDPDDPDSLSHDRILSIYEDGEGTLWVGTLHGLNRFDREMDNFTRYEHDPDEPGSLVSDVASIIYEDSSGTLWIGTDDGLERFDRETGTFTHFTEKDGLANDSIAGILEDDRGNLWLGTTKGIAKFDPRTGEFKNYDVRYGLQSNEFNRGAFCKSSSGEMYFGGVNGFNAFYPDDITDNPHLPPVTVTDFRIFNRPVVPGDDSPLQKPIEETEYITLSYRDYVFSFEFAALDYTIPGKNGYAYMLEGFDRGWNYVDSSRRFASYANLPAGEYVFHVKGSNNDGVWNEEGTSIGVKVTPPPWKTWWAYTLYALLGGAVVFGYIRYRARETERKNLEQTAWAVQEERDRIATLLESRRQLLASISHDLRTPVAIVRGHLESAPPDSGRLSMLDTVLQELDRLQTLLEDLFTFSRLEVDSLTLNPSPTDVEKVARRAVGAIAAPAWQQGKVEVALEAAGADNMWVMTDERRLLQVLINLLHNAVRHTLPGGIVAVGLSSGPDTVSIRVQDTGEGIDPADLPHIWERFYQGQNRATGTRGGAGLGLTLVKELTETMGGTVGVESTPGEGSCFIVTLPRIEPPHADSPL